MPSLSSAQSVKLVSLSALLVIVPLAVLAILRFGSDDSLAGVTFRASAVLATATAREIADEKPVKVSLSWQKGEQLVAPRWSGTVTGVAARSESTLRSGDRVATIDGVDRIAFASNPPLYRPISSGTSGKDVAELHRLLQLMGFLKTLPDAPETATFATTTAIRAFAGSIGVEATVSAFDPAWIVWLPSEAFAVDTLDLQIGRPAPAAGQPFAEAPATLTGAQLSAAGQDSLVLDPSVAWAVVLNGKSLAVDAASLQLKGDALRDLPGAVKTGAEAVSATVRRATPLRAVAVPSTGVMTGGNGQLCVWVPVGGTYESRTVTLNGARAGISNVVTGLQAGEQLLANPAQVLERPECPSS